MIISEANSIPVQRWPIRSGSSRTKPRIPQWMS